VERRTVLTGIGAGVAALAGCAGEADREGGEETTAADATPARSDTAATAGAATTAPGVRRLAPGTATTVAGGASLAVSDPTVQGSVVEYYSGFFGVGRADGVQFVVVEAVGDADVEPTSFVLVRDGRVERPPRTQQFVRGVVRDCDGPCVAVPVEAAPAASAAVAYRPDDEVRAAWALDDATVGALPAVPDLRLRDAAVVDADGDVGVRLSVENVGDRDGAFLALVAPAWVADGAEPVGFAVPRGETVTETVVPAEIQALDPGEAGFTVDPTAGTRRFEVGAES
jgi:hypothetical protein